MTTGGDEGRMLELTDSRALSVIPADRLRRYERHVAAFDLTEEQKLELLTAVYSIMRSFAEIGFGLDSVQRVLPAIFENASNGGPDDVSLGNINDDKEEHAAPARVAGEDGFE